MLVEIVQDLRMTFEKENLVEGVDMGVLVLWEIFHMFDIEYKFHSC